MVQVLILCQLFAILSVGSAAIGCKYSDVSEALAAVLCLVESEAWNIPATSPTVANAGCLLGGNRCNKVMTVPLESQIPASPSPPSAKNKQYQLLATTAEKVVPQTWWRQGFANDVFLLTHNDSDLPRKLFDPSKLRNKKLKNIAQCVTRQQFIRKSISFNIPFEVDATAEQNNRCSAMSDPTVIKFQALWKASSHLGGSISATGDWAPLDDTLRSSAEEVLHYFYANYGGIWTGCFKLEKEATCRGAFAAASLVVGVHLLHSIAGPTPAPFTESVFASGYLLATVGRGLLHGDLDTTGNVGITSWAVRNADFVALQAAFLTLYSRSFGRVYNQQLEQYIPMAFAPDFEVQVDKKWANLAPKLEPVYTSLRNWMFTEAASLIDFGPYTPLVAFKEVREDILQNKRRRVLIDVGANGFFASPKYIIDSYAAYLPFTDAIMIEPEPHFSATVPEAYTNRYNITFMPLYVEVNTGTELDMIKLLPTIVTKEDFVVLKFDVDPNRHAQGPTMEWGFLFSLMQQKHIAELVDELYIELHFHFPSLYWKHLHSNWEALDAFRYLRKNGAIVHSWP